MLERLSVWFYKRSNTWVVLLALVIFILFTILVLPSQAQDASDSTGDAGSPDLSFFYTPEYLYELAETYGKQGREEYVRARFTFDIIWPLVYTFFLTTTTSWVFRKITTTDNLLRRVNLLPLLAMLFDLLENVSTSLVMIRYPASSPLLAWVAPIFTTSKWLLVGGSVLVLFIGVLFGVWNWIKGKFDNS